MVNACLYTILVSYFLLLQADSWIDEKQKTLGDDRNSLQDMKNLQEKMKKLQKHQAFEAELVANEKLIAEVKQVKKNQAKILW